MHYKITVSRAMFMSFAVVLLVLISLVCPLAPLWHVLMGSLSNPTQVGITQGLILYPLQNLDTHAYSIILTYQRLWNGYLNTFILHLFTVCVDWCSYYCGRLCIFSQSFPVPQHLYAHYQLDYAF